MGHWTEEQYQAYQARMAGLKTPSEKLSSHAKSKPNRNAPNKTELRFEQEIIKPSLSPEAAYGFQCMTFLLAPGLRYTPDWVVWRKSDFERSPGWLTCYEIKGAHVWDDARVKFLTSRKLFPWITWEAWQWKGGEWREIWGR